MTEKEADFEVAAGGKITIHGAGTYLLRVDGKSVTVVVQAVPRRHDPEPEDTVAAYVKGLVAGARDPVVETILEAIGGGPHDPGPERAATADDDAGVQQWHNPGEEAKEL